LYLALGSNSQMRRYLCLQTPPLWWRARISTLPSPLPSTQRATRW
jgi:hypothetical protein